MTSVRPLGHRRASTRTSDLVGEMLLADWGSWLGETKGVACSLVLATDRLRHLADETNQMHSE